MKKILDYIRDKHDVVYKIFLFLLCTITIVYFFPKEASFKYDFQKNKPWFYEDLIAPYDIPIFPTEQEIEIKKLQISQNKTLYFNIDNRVEGIQIDSYKKNIKSSWKDFYESYGEKNKKWYQSNQYNEEALKNTVISKGVALLKKVYNKGIIERSPSIKIDTSNQEKMFYVKKDKFYAAYTYEEVFTVKQAYQYLATKLNAKDDLEAYILWQLERLLNNEAYNLIFDKVETDLALEKEIKKAATVDENIIKGQGIIKRGDIVDDYKYRVLKSFEKKYKSEHLTKSKRAIITIGQLILVSLIVMCLALYLIFFRPHLLNDNKRLFFILITITTVVVGASIILHYNWFSVYIFPFCLVPLIIRSFFDTRTAFFCHLIVVLLLGFIMPNGFNFMFMQLVAGLVGIYGFVNFRNRSQLFYTTIAILFAYLISHSALSIITEGDFKKIDWLTFGWFSIAAGLTLLAYPIIYFSEKIFGFVSDVTLLELADTNNPLLRELSKKAPGTFQHSLQVANLAEEVIHIIGGNSLLIRTAALYHDVGKIHAPMYFIENQSTGVNPHDELSYEESANIIVSHVIEGVQLAKKYKLPELIIDFIRTHHGTTKTGYFYNMYVKDHPDEADIEKMFQYPGPIPFSKETAVLMMADSVEAASRSIKDPNMAKIDGLVEKIIDHQISENQFANANITFKEITQIKRIFKKMLMNIYHVRIEYPK